MWMWLKSLFRKRIKTAQDLVEFVGVGNYGALSEWITFNIWYKKDASMLDQWKTSERTLKDRSGDCEDFAVLCHDCLKLMGISDIKILCLFPVKGVGHAVTVFREAEGKPWNWFNNGKYMDGDKDFEELIMIITVQCGWSKLNYYKETDLKGNWL